MARFRNWGGTVSFRPASLLQPRGVDELRAILRDAAANRRRVRVAGSGHSWSPLVECPDILLDLRHFDECRVVDRDGGVAAVGAGVRLSTLNNVLADAGLALRNLGAISAQTAVGAAMTGTHGTGPSAVLATQVRRLTLVAADGSVREIGPDEADLFDAARVSLGALGVITEVQFDVVPRFHLRLERRALSFDEAFGDAMARRLTMESYQQYKWMPLTDRVMFEHAEITQATADIADRRNPPRNDPLEWASTRVAAAAGRVIPGIVPGLNRMARTLKTFRPGVWVGRSDLVLNVPMAPLYHELEYALPFDRGVEAMRRYREIIERDRPAVNFPVIVRFAGADRLWLSMAHGRPTIFINLLASPGRAFARAREAVEPMLQALDGRPHWGKLSQTTPEILGRLYPRYDDFRRLMARLDPAGVFRNAHIDALFPRLG
jgi:FAD/FMN-containing dehydrogenase